MSDETIFKVRLCDKCQAAGRTVAMDYSGAQRISPTITLVAFSCEHGHASGEHLPDTDAQRLIRERRSNGVQPC